MKKKFALGCLIVAIAVLIVGSGLAYFYVIRPLTNTVKAGMELPRLAELDQQVSNKRAFAAPESGELTAGQVDRYMQATSAVMNGLKGKADELAQKYDQISSQGNPGIRQVLNAYTDIIKLVVQAKEQQVDALNAAGFSLSEYDWVKRSVIRAAGQAYTVVDLTALSKGEVEEAADEAVADDAVADDAVAGDNAAGDAAAVPEANVELVKPYADAIEKYLPLVAFGL